MQRFQPPRVAAIVAASVVILACAQSVRAAEEVVEYRLTEVGAGLEQRLRELVVHLYEEMPKVLESQAAHDSRRAS